MSYYQTYLSPYRTDIWKENKEILSEDYEWLCSSIKDRGVIFGMAFVSIMGISLAKVVCHTFTQLKKPRMTYDHLSLARNLKADTMLDKLSRREAIDELENHDAYCSDDAVKTQRADSINALRTYLYENDLILHATVLKTVEHECTEDEIKEMYRLGKFTKPLVTSHVTFGNDLDLMIKDVLKDGIDLKKENDYTYFEVVNNDFLSLKDSLFRLYGEEVQIQFD